MRVSFLLAYALFLALAPPAVRADDKKPVPVGYDYTLWTSHRVQSGDTSYGLAASVLVCEQQSHRPVAWFGAAKPTEGKSQYLYLLVFKTPADFGKGNTVGSSSKTSFSLDGGANAEGVIVATTLEKKVEVAYKFTTAAKTHAVQKQSLTVGGQEVKEGAPRVFVVDLTAEKVTYTPVKVELPKDAPDVSQESKEWGSVVQQGIEQLKKDSPELKKLLDVK